MVDAISSSTAVTTESQSDQNSLSSDFDQFLLLLTTQLQNQDPLSPMDSTEFTNQLVSFSGVEQQIKMNEKLDTMVSSAQTSETSMALGYIGLQVSIESDIFKYVENSTIAMTYKLDTDAASATMNIYNTDNEIIYTEELTGLSEGAHPITWDGRTNNTTTNDDGEEVPVYAESAVYYVGISALDTSQKGVDTSTIVPGYVEGVETGDDSGVMLLVNEQLVPVSDITRARL